MKPLLLAAAAAALCGCATRPPYTDATIGGERQAYIHCAVTKAFSLSSSPEPALHIAQLAVNECEQEKIAVYDKLKTENARRLQAKAFAESYVSELSSTMVSQIAVRLMQVRNRKGSGNIKPSGRSIDI